MARSMGRWFRSLGGVALLLAAACGGGHVVQGTGDSLPDPASASEDAGAGAPPADCRGTSDAGGVCTGSDCCASDAGTGDASAGHCGDGVLDSAEECDDGNTEDGDGCSAACLKEVCGNGRVDPGETCDVVAPTCSDTCKTIPVAPGCGDGRLVSGEECDPPDGLTCNAQCRLVRCGDGRVDPPEQCDDGNTVSGDGCSSTCVEEICGDRIVNQAPGVEQCEPPGEGSCDATCHTIECGNGIVQGLEQCDDGNHANGDGCNENCRKEVCGNGELDPGEDCEPPHSATCDANCHALRAECGNGVVEAGEECDDNNVAFGDGCSPSCLVEQCGNGRVEAPAEECEPPGTAGCNAKCRVPRCGDGFVDLNSGEECEDGNLDNGDGCSSTCQIERCGNGRLEAPEQCEPPGTDACDANCRVRANSAQGVQLPASASLFQLRNSGFADSLDSWQVAKTPGSDVSSSSLDAAGDDGASGSVELSVKGSGGSVDGARVLALVIGDPTLNGASLGQCVQTVSGATYRLSAQASLLAGAVDLVSVQLGARFYAGSDCAGPVVDGVSTDYSLDDTGEWQTLTLPPPSPISMDTFAAPLGAGSMLVWVQVSQDEEDVSVLLDDVQLQRGAAPVCGDGLPEGDEECEPSVTPGCTAACKLPVVCGDGVAAPSECGPNAGAGACPSDCPKAAAVCGDGQITAPEECDPPVTGVCSNVCTLLHAVCGDGRIDTAQGEQCDPPNGDTCDPTCKTMKCGDGKVQAPEECDPPGAACSPHCRKFADYPATCGDGVLQGAEECDPPNPKTWCSSACQRRNPATACGDGTIDRDLGEGCDPPSYADNCDSECQRPVCGDGTVGGAEQCDPPDGVTCGRDCHFIPGGATDCQACLADTCSGPAPQADLFSPCFGLPGVAQAGPAKGVPLRQLCADVVACLASTGCDAETGSPNPVSCYCGKQVLVDSNGYGSVLSDCRDGVTEATGACRTAFERAAEGALPGTVLAAMDPKYGKPALTAALGLMWSCGHPPPPSGSQPAPTTPQRSCSTRCTGTPACGDGVVGIGEACDPRDPEWGDQGSRWPAGVAHPTCDPTYCTIYPCGNGTVDTKWPDNSALGPTLAQPPNWKPETCDVADPYTSAAKQCDLNCQLITTCGDGKLTASKEACDPGPGQSWAGCCHPGDKDPAGLLGCDVNKNGVVDPDEGCQHPAVCGNGIREGAEECDEPPAAGHCDANCKLIRTSPCDVCTQANCGPKLTACFNGDPSTRTGCIAVDDCYTRTQCGNDGILVCLCGDLPQDVCVSSQAATGLCHAVIEQYIASACPGVPTVSCMANFILGTSTPVGVAGQLVQCQQNFCFDECFGTAP